MLIDTPRRDLVNIANAYDTERRMYFGLDLISNFFSDLSGISTPEASQLLAGLGYLRVYIYIDLYTYIFIHRLIHRFF